MTAPDVVLHSQSSYHDLSSYLIRLGLTRLLPWAAGPFGHHTYRTLLLSGTVPLGHRSYQASCKSGIVPFRHMALQASVVLS